VAKRQAVEPRFLAKVNKTDTCWLWTAWIERNGYGRFWLDGRQQGAHRAAYEMYVGPIPDGLEIDHLCRVRHCVNPAHLDAVTAAENIRRMTPHRADYKSAKTHCPQGHPYDAENTLVGKDGGRSCRACKKETGRLIYERDRELAIERARQWRENNLERARELARESQRRYRAKKKGQAA
jgi:hypothetical protein